MRTAAVVAAGSSPIVTFGALQLLGASQSPRWTGIGDELGDPRTWLTLVLMLIAGAFGGVAYELLLRKGAIELPHRVTRRSIGRRRYAHAPAETLIALGTLGRALVGSAAAMCVLLVVAPTNAHSAIAFGVTAGAAAPAVIRLMRKQLLFAADAIERLKDASRSAGRQSAGRRHEATPAPQTAGA
jgi:hypothetical protein